MQAPVQRRSRKVPGQEQSAWADDDACPPRLRLQSERAVFACEGVIDIVAALFNVSGRELRDQRRSTFDVSRVRQIAMYVAHVVLGISMREVGNGFGRDRTTVLHACHQIEDLRDDTEFDNVVALAERVVRAAFAGRQGR